MKTKEEILKDKGITELTAFHAYPYMFKATIEAMQLYSDQQNKELREEREQLAEQYRKDGEQINDMVFEINKLKEDRPFQFSPTNSEREWQVKIVNDYIHPNQEDWQKMNAVCNSLIEIQQLRKEIEEWRNRYNQSTERNIDLRKENEELRNKALMSVAHDGEIENKNSRLIELLKESVGWLQSGRVDPLHNDIPIPEEVQKLIYDIDNELNPKP